MSNRIEVTEGVMVVKGEGRSESSPAPVVYRDPDDVRVLRRMAGSLGVLGAVIVVLLGTTIWMYWRRPDRIVVVRNMDGSERVVVLNDRYYGEADGVRIQPEQVGAGDRQALATEFLRRYYAVNPARRAEDMREAIGMLVPVYARQFAGYLENSRIASIERDEQHTSSWEVKSAEIDKTNPNAVNVLGQRILTKVSGNTIKREAQLIQASVVAAPDPAGRQTSNARTGLQIVGFKEKVVGVTAIQ